MIFATVNQLDCFLLFLFFGVFAGFLNGFLRVIFLIKFQKNAIKIIFDAIFYTFFSIFYVFFINFYNFGKYPLSLLVATILGFVWVLKVGSKLVVFLQNKWYNICKRKGTNEKHNIQN